jgi:hypothetical protein
MFGETKTPNLSLDSEGCSVSTTVVKGVGSGMWTDVMETVCPRARARVCACVCACVCARARVRARVRVRVWKGEVSGSLTWKFAGED